MNCSQALVRWLDDELCIALRYRLGGKGQIKGNLLMTDSKAPPTA